MEEGKEGKEGEIKVTVIKPWDMLPFIEWCNEEPYKAKTLFNIGREFDGVGIA